MTLPDEISTLIRAVCVVLAVFCLIAIAMLYPWWVKQTRTVRFMLLSNLVFSVVAAYGVTEAIFMSTPGAGRAVTTMVSLLYCAIGLILGLRDAHLEKKEKES